MDRIIIVPIFLLGLAIAAISIGLCTKKRPPADVEKNEVFKKISNKIIKERFDFDYKNSSHLHFNSKNFNISIVDDYIYVEDINGVDIEFPSYFYLDKKNEKIYWGLHNYFLLLYKYRDVKEKRKQKIHETNAKIIHIN